MNKDRFLFFFNNFYALLQEANLFNDEQSTNDDFDIVSDPFISEQLKIVKKFKAKYLIAEKKDRTDRLSQIIEALKNEDENNLINLLGKNYSEQAITLYNNFKDESENDTQSIQEEKLFLALIEILENEEES